MELIINAFLVTVGVGLGLGLLVILWVLFQLGLALIVFRKTEHIAHYDWSQLRRKKAR